MFCLAVVLAMGSPAMAVPVSESKPIAWQWSETPDLFPAVDLIAADEKARYVLHHVPDERDTQHHAVLRRDNASGAVAWSRLVAQESVPGAALAVDDRRVYMAAYSRIASGCKVAAFDVASGEPLWTTALEGIGPIEHSKYHNRVQMRLVDGGLALYGHEASRFIELLDPETGGQLSNERLPATPLVRPVGEALYHDISRALEQKTTYRKTAADLLTVRPVPPESGWRSLLVQAVGQLDGLPVASGRYSMRLSLSDGGALAVKAERGPLDPAKSSTPPNVSRDGKCDPIPKEGSACRQSDGYCILSWGQPGGWSSALWCTDGRWRIEEEKNLDER